MSWVDGMAWFGRWARRALWAAGFVALRPGLEAKEIRLLNASHDPTRSLYQEVNAAFAADWEARTGDRVRVDMSHAGSAKQARAVLDGLDADVVSLALAHDVDVLAAAGLLSPEWRGSLPRGSVPFHSTIVFLVRPGNPKNIGDWEDLIRPGVSIVTPNPKTSGGARWNYLAAWGWALLTRGGDGQARDYVASLFRNVPVLDSGARGAALTFIERGLGDVLLTWESEAFLARRELGPGRFEIVLPSLSVRADPPVARVDKVTERRGTARVAQAYLEFLFTPDAQAMALRNGFRTSGEAPGPVLFTVEQVFGGWAEAQARHFAHGGEFDRMLEERFARAEGRP